MIGAGHPWHRPEVHDGAAAVVDDVPDLLAGLPSGAWDRPPQQAMVLPLGPPQDGPATGFVVAGLNPHRALDESYRGFVELLVAQVASGLFNARAYEAERARAEALAELDRAKTDFFSNVSHEFRTPLTLIMGPIDELRRDADPGPVDPARLRTELDVMHRNGLRLGKLVNSLLDYSRLQARRSTWHGSPVSSPARSAPRSRARGSASSSTARRCPRPSSSTATAGRRSSSTCCPTRSSSPSTATSGWSCARSGTGSA